MSMSSCAGTRLRQATRRFSSTQARRSTYWPGVGQGKQRRPRVGSRGAPSAALPFGSCGAVTAHERLLRGGQRFESPQLRQEVRGGGACSCRPIEFLAVARGISLADFASRYLPGALVERSPGAACTHWKAPPYHGAHVKRTLSIAVLHRNWAGSLRAEPV
jgi:hypothetical protein